MSEVKKIKRIEIAETIRDSLNIMLGELRADRELCKYLVFNDGSYCDTQLSKEILNLEKIRNMFNRLLSNYEKYGEDIVMDKAIKGWS